MFALERTCCLSGARASRAQGASQVAEVRKIRLIIIIYYIFNGKYGQYFLAFGNAFGMQEGQRKLIN